MQASRLHYENAQANKVPRPSSTGRWSRNQSLVDASGYQMQAAVVQVRGQFTRCFASPAIAQASTT